MKLSERVRNAVQKWLQIQPAVQRGNIVIREPYSRETDIMCSRIWYRGEADELKQFYKQLPTTDAGYSRFWAAVPEGGEVRKLHTGLPGVIVDTLAGMVAGDFDGMLFTDEVGADLEEPSRLWDTIADEIVFGDVLTEALCEMLVTGGGAFRISWDKSLSMYPTVEFFGEDRCEVQRRRGFVTGISFYTDYFVGNDRYQLEEIREPGRIRYMLWDAGGTQVDLKTVPELAGTEDIDIPANISTAIPFRVWNSTKWKGWGKPIFDGKTDDFDALDEVVSQWMDAVRQGRVQKYIPGDMIPIDPNTLQPMKPDSFGTTFRQIELPKTEGGSANARIDVVQPDIQYDALLTSYKSALDICLQGLISPASLGINVAATSSGESKRESKDVTGFTRNRITAKLEKVLPQLVCALLQVYDWINGREIQTYTPTASFGEYAAPDFGTRAKALREADACGAMSIEAKVEELWGSSKKKAWIDEEVRRIKAEKGFLDMEEPAGGDELP